MRADIAQELQQKDKISISAVTKWKEKVPQITAYHEHNVTLFYLLCLTQMAK